MLRFLLLASTQISSLLSDNNIMKKTILLAVAFGSIGSQCYAYNAVFQNWANADANAVPILDNTGTPIAVGAGYVAIGTFSGAVSVDTIATSFTAFGDAATGFANSLGVGGLYNLTSADSIPEGTVGGVVGEQAYVVIGNAATLAGSSHFAVISTGSAFGTEDSFGNGEINLGVNPGNIDSALLLGTKLNDVDTGLGVVFTNGIQLSDGAAIPEPSTALLSLVGLGFLARRRR
jgi:hypothetical protein